MKKNFLSVLMVIVMIAALMVSATGCNNETGASDERIAQLEQENAALKAQVEQLTAQLSGMQQHASLQSWTLTAEAWNDSNGATVTFTAVPVSYAEGQRAALSVRMGDLEAESTNCVWDGSTFTGSVELSAADGYSYYCILTSSDGTQEELALNTPENTTDDTLVYLGTNLTAYANLIVEDWEAASGNLVIKSGYAQAQLPRLTAGDQVTLSKASLVLEMNGEEMSRQELTMPAGEGEGTFELALAGNSFAMPGTEDDYQLDLMLEIVLSNGTTVTVSGGSWYNNSGELLLVVG